MDKNIVQKINWKGSLFLDTLRLLSALVVLYVHAHDQWFPSQTHSSNEPGNIAHTAVVIFFVLSGYVISHTTTSNNRGKVQYVVARLSRLYSVVLPALIVTAIIELIVKYVNPVLSTQYSRGLSWPRYIIAGSFLNEVWFLSAAPPINIPLWSLSFEFWYYTIFGLWFYKSTGWKSLILPISACIVAGPKILLMMPIWLFGFEAYRLPKPKVEPIKGWATIFVILSFTMILVSYLPAVPYGIGLKPFFFANQFISDWIVGILIAFTLWLLPSQSLTEKPGWINKFRRVSDLTFPIYVLHYPLLILWSAIIKQKLYNSLQMFQAIITVLFISSLIGLLLESNRSKWFKFFEWLVSAIRTKSKKLKLGVSAFP